MTDLDHARLLIRETDNAGTLVTHQERALRNALQLAVDEIVRLRAQLAEATRQLTDTE
jgi:hypothetical protein